MKKQNKFADGVNIKKIFLIFITMMILGTFYEELIIFLRKVINEEHIFWEFRRGLVIGPFSPVYGLGAVLLTIFLVNKKLKLIWIFFICTIFCGLSEYLVSFFQELFFNYVSWDYSNHFLNINGRTTIPYMIVWGLFGIIFVKFIYNFVSNLIEKIPIKIGNLITIILAIFIIFDFFISTIALVRLEQRKKEKPPITFIGKLCDKYYTDEFLKERYHLINPN